MTYGSWAATEDREVRGGDVAGGDVVAHFVCSVFSWFEVLIALMDKTRILGRA